MNESDKEKALNLFAKNKCLNFPIGVYLIAKSGSFLKANKRLYDTLGIDRDIDISTISICDFFINKDDSTRILEELAIKEENGEYIEKRTTPFVIDDQIRYMQIYCKSIRDPENRVNILAYMGCLVDVTEEELHKQLFERLPIGAYRLDKDDKVTSCNKAFAEIHGYNSIKEMIGMPITDLYLNSADAHAFHQKIDKEDAVVNQLVKLLKKNDEILFASISAYKLHGPRGEYIGRQGAIMDSRMEGLYRELMDELAVGFYRVKNVDGEDQIRDCNLYFLNMFGFKDIKDAIGNNIKNLHFSKETYQEYLEGLKKESAQKSKFKITPVHVKTLQGARKTLQANISNLYDEAGNIKGRLGAFVDHSNEYELEEQVRELTEDIGKVFHSFTALFSMVVPVIDYSIRYHNQYNFSIDRSLYSEEITPIIQAPLNRLIDWLDRFKKYTIEKDRNHIFDQDSWATFENCTGTLIESQNSEIPPEHQYHIAREAAFQLNDLISIIKKGILPRELIKQVKFCIDEIIAIANLVSLYQAREGLLEADHQIRELREFVVSRRKPLNPKEEVFFADLVNQAKQAVEEFANSKKIIFRVRIDRKIKVKVREREFIRALINLLHNAIKYSWHRENNLAWVSVYSNITVTAIQLTIENWGVPIPKDELEQELIYSLGFRGRLSSDRKRPGTGIGLYDSRQVIEQHGGTLYLTSVPARPGGISSDYKQPFLTKATIKLPI